MSNKKQARLDIKFYLGGDQEESPYLTFNSFLCTWVMKYKDSSWHIPNPEARVLMSSGQFRKPLFDYTEAVELPEYTDEPAEDSE